MATESDQLEYENSDPEESPSATGPSEQSYIKYHVTITHLSLEGRTMRELLQAVTRQLEATVGPIQAKYVHGFSSVQGVSVQVGFERDEDAGKLVKGLVKLGLPGAEVKPTDVFAAYLEWMERAKPQRARSRSPRSGIPVFYLFFLPPKFQRDEILEGLTQAGVAETPKIEQLFTNWKSLGGLVVKLTFKGREVIDVLCAREIQVRKKSILLVQSGPKNSLDSVLRTTLESYQVLSTSDSPVSLDRVSEGLSRFGTLANAAESQGVVQVTFCRSTSAREACNSSPFRLGTCVLTLRPAFPLPK